MKGRVITEETVIQIEQGLVALRTARTAFRAAGAKKTADYIQCAIKSGEGALNHARTWETRARRNSA